MIGPRLAHYEVLAPLGRGGMGEVHRARDTKLGREVALKLLPEDFARDPERLARFRREAKVLASLNHPNIAAIYGLDEAEGRHFLVMELAGGEDLSVRMAQGPMSVEEVLGVARQLAAGLEQAHEAGVVHRDLKPANVKLADDGTVKILDFGLARAYAGESTGEGDPAQSPTITAAMTQQGVILGTAAYMSPEQARGRSVDRRADIWAFGVILFEMLTGRRLFAGETISDTLAGVLKTEADLESLPADTPPALRWLIERCLQKKPEQRLRDIGEARVVLEGDLEQVPAFSSLALPAVAAPSSRPWAWGGLALLALLLGVAGGWWLRGGAPPESPLQASLLPPAGHGFDLETGGHLALSPDGRRLAFVAVDSTRQQSLWVRSLDGAEAYPLAGTEGAHYPFWSPDGSKVGFFVEGRLRKIDADGGVATTVCAAGGGRGGAWLPDGRILFAPTNRDAIHVVSSNGGEPAAVTVLDSTETSHRWPEILPDGRHFLYIHLLPDGARLAWRSVDEDDEKTLLEGVLRAEYVDGDLLFVRDDALWARPFDPRAGEFAGEEFLVAENVVSSSNFANAAYTAGGGGSLILAAGTISTDATVATMDRRGAVLETFGIEGNYPDDLVLSPDGRYVAMALYPPETASEPDIWIRDLQRGTLSRFTLGEKADDPIWSPDGRRVAYSRPPHVVVRSAVGQREILQEYDLGTDAVLHGWSPDGSFLVFSAQGEERDVLRLVLDGGEVLPLVQNGKFNAHPALSPDGEWLVYMSTETGEAQVYLTGVAPGSGTWQVSREGGYQPLWSPDGEEIFFRFGMRLFTVPVDLSEGAPDLGTEQPLLDLPLRAGRSFTHQYQVTPEGNFLFVRESDLPAEIRPLRLLRGWRRIVLRD